MDTPWWTRGVGQEAADKLRNVVQAAVPSPDSPLEEAVLSELVSEAKFPGNWEKYRDFDRRDL